MDEADRHTEDAVKATSDTTSPDLRNADADTGPARVEVRGVEFCYGEFIAATGLDAKIAPGEFVSIIGPSGCGKSTLLQGIGGLLSPSSGEIRMGGEVVTGPRPRDATYVFQDLALLPWRTARRNVELPLELRSVSRGERRRRAEEALALVGLADSSTKFPHQLSGGMRQRVALARAFVSDADILLFDEPFAALDEQARMVMGLELLRLLREHEKTVVFVTHSLHEAAFLSDRVLVMSKQPGRILADIAVTLPTPREPEMMRLPEFHQTYDRLFELLFAESLQRRPQ